MNKRLLVNFFLAALLVTGVFVYAKESFSSVILRESLFLSSSFIALLAGIFALRSYGFTGPRMLTILFLTAGIGYWFIGDVLFNYYSYVLHTDPFPSVADIFYLLAYPFFLTALINEVRHVGVRLHQVHKGFICFFALTCLVFVGLVSYFGIYQAFSPDEGILSNIIAISYGVGDLMLIVLTMLLLSLAWEFRGGALARVWLLFFFSMLANLVADMIFALYTQEYTSQIWFYKSVPDMLWMLSYVLFAAAFFDLGFSITDAFQKIKKLKKNKS